MGIGERERERKYVTTKSFDYTTHKLSAFVVVAVVIIIIFSLSLFPLSGTCYLVAVCNGSIRIVFWIESATVFCSFFSWSPPPPFYPSVSLSPSLLKIDSELGRMTSRHFLWIKSRTRFCLWNFMEWESKMRKRNVFNKPHDASSHSVSLCRSEEHVVQRREKMNSKPTNFGDHWALCWFRQDTYWNSFLLACVRACVLCVWKLNFVAHSSFYRSCKCEIRFLHTPELTYHHVVFSSPHKSNRKRLVKHLNWINIHSFRILLFFTSISLSILSSHTILFDVLN